MLRLGEGAHLVRGLTDLTKNVVVMETLEASRPGLLDDADTNRLAPGAPPAAEIYLS